MINKRARPNRTTSVAQLRAARQVAVTILGNMAAPLSGILIAPILAHELGAAGRGEVAAATSPVVLASMIATLGIPEATTYFVARRQNNALAIVRIGIGTLALSGLL